MHNHNIVANVGTYTNKFGEEKTLYKTIGKVYETAKGVALKLDATFNLAALAKRPDGSVWLNVYPPKEDAQLQEKTMIGDKVPMDFNDDELPF